ncbi:MAG: hypothetical protein ACXVA7_21830, partial [Isosphaeraceae bacterium]
VMPRRPHYQRGIKRGQICGWPDGVGTPDEVAARLTYHWQSDSQDVCVAGRATSLARGQVEVRSVQ